MVVREEIQKNIKKKANGLHASHLAVNAKRHTLENSNITWRYKMKTKYLFLLSPEIVI